MVGTQRNGPTWAPIESTQHEGRPGWTTKQIIAILPLWAATQPDIIVIHLGTNDVGQNHTLPELLTDMSSLLHNISIALPNARVFLCTILYMINSINPQWVPMIEAYNTALKTNFGSRSVSIIDVASATGLCNANDSPLHRFCAQCNSSGPCITDPTFYDRVHPTAAGYNVFAGVLAAALAAAL